MNRFRARITLPHAHHIYKSVHENPCFHGQTVVLMCALFVGRFNFRYWFAVVALSRRSSPGLSCAACWEALAGVFASAGALLHVILSLPLPDEAIGTEPDSGHQALALFYLHCSTSDRLLASLWSDLTTRTSANIAVLKKFSITALSKQFPFLDILWVIVFSFSSSWYLLCWYCHPWSECNMALLLLPITSMMCAPFVGRVWLILIPAWGTQQA